MRAKYIFAEPFLFPLGVLLSKHEIDRGKAEVVRGLVFVFELARGPPAEDGRCAPRGDVAGGLSGRSKKASLKPPRKRREIRLRISGRPRKERSLGCGQGARKRMEAVDEPVLGEQRDALSRIVSTRARALPPRSGDLLKRQQTNLECERTENLIVSGLKAGHGSYITEGNES